MIRILALQAMTQQVEADAAGSSYSIGCSSASSSCKGAQEIQ